jgi:hypothetical protein
LRGLKYGKLTIPKLFKNVYLTQQNGATISSEFRHHGHKAKKMKVLYAVAAAVLAVACAEEQKWDTVS